MLVEKAPHLMISSQNDRAGCNLRGAGGAQSVLVPSVSTRARRTGCGSSTRDEQRGAVRHHDNANSTQLRIQCARGVVTCVRAVWLHTIPVPVHTGLLTFPPVAKAMAITQQPVCSSPILIHVWAHSSSLWEQTSKYPNQIPKFMIRVYNVR